MATIDVLLRVRDSLTPALKAADGAAAKLEESLDSASKSASKAVADISSRVDGMTSRVTSRVKAFISSQTDSFNKMKASLEDTKNQFPALTRLLSGLTGGVMSLGAGAGKAAAGIGAVAAGGAAAVGAAAVGLVAMGAAAAVVTAGLVAGAGAVVYFGKQAQEALRGFEDIEPLNIGVDPAAQASMDTAIASLDSLRLIAMAAVVVLAENLAPIVGQVANVLVGMGLAALEAFKGFAQGGPVIQSLAALFVDVLYEAIMLPVRAFQLILAGLAKVAELAGLPADAFNKTNEIIDEGIEGLKKSAEATVNAALGYSGMSDALGEFAETGSAFTGSVAERIKALEKEKKAAAGAAEAEKKKAAEEKAAAEEAKKREAEEKKRLAQEEADRKQASEANAAFDTLIADAMKLTVDAEGLQEAVDEIDFGALTKAMQGSINLTQVDNTIKAGSSLQGLTAAAGPVAGVVMGGVNAVSDIGKGGGLLKDIETTLKDFTAGLKAIPAMLADVIKSIFGDLLPSLLEELPGIVTDIVNTFTEIVPMLIASFPSLVASLVDSVAGILMGLVESLPALMMSILGVLLSPQFWLDMTLGIASSLLKAVIGMISKMLADLPKKIAGLADSFIGIVVGMIETFPSMIAGILGMIVEILPMLLMDVVGMLLSPKFWLGIGKAILTSLLDALKGIFGKVFGNKEKTGIFQKEGAIAKAFRGEGSMKGFASGLDRVGETGMAVIHEGEEVVRKGGSMSAASMGRGGSGLRDIHLHGVMAGDRAGLMREIRQALREGEKI